MAPNLPPCPRGGTSPSPGDAGCDSSPRGTEESMKVKLVVVQGKPEGLQIPIPGPAFSIGRDPKCNLRPNNELVSKVHCTFVIEGETILLEDKGSTNGTFVNNERLQGKREVKDGDLIKVGSLVFALSAALPQPAAVAAKPQQDDDAMQWLLGDAE